MKTVNFLVEKVNGGYTGYAQDFSILTDGKTVRQVCDNAKEALAEQCETTGEPPQDFDVQFTYDTASAFDALKINVAAFGRRYGLNSSLISQYASGAKKPSGKQKRRVEAALHQYAQDILRVRIA